MKLVVDNYNYDMDIKSNGSGLHLLICTDHLLRYNWMSFSAWYSVVKALPNTKIGICCARNQGERNMIFYPWVSRSNSKFIMHQNVGKKNGIPYLNKIFSVYCALQRKIVEQPLIVMDADMMAMREFSQKQLKILNEVSFASEKNVGSLWYLNGISLEKLGKTINTMCEIARTGERNNLDLLALSQEMDVTVIEDLCNEAHEESITTFTHYRERCGNFYKKDYEEVLKAPPFGNVFALRSNDMSVNEKKVFSLWGQMPLMYGALNK